MEMKDAIIWIAILALSLINYMILQENNFKTHASGLSLQQGINEFGHFIGFRRTVIQCSYGTSLYLANNKVYNKCLLQRSSSLSFWVLGA